MEAEKLKVIALGMGWNNCSFNNINQVRCYRKGKLHQEPYNPLTNDTQCMEIMEKLRIPLVFQFDTKLWWADSWKGKTINEAVCNAAYEYFKGEQE